MHHVPSRALETNAHPIKNASRFSRSMRAFTRYPTVASRRRWSPRPPPARRRREIARARTGHRYQSPSAANPRIRARWHINGAIRRLPRGAREVLVRALRRCSKTHFVSAPAAARPSGEHRDALVPSCSHHRWAPASNPGPARPSAALSTGLRLLVSIWSQ